ncbi:hypothetical protein BG015_010271 [Linnemannia schmuckeri]|uniref:Uncharacterized protein n=1 Tax=Linnemannia schmuckeri TaxID=64567 RepID=A0A9P5RUP7_9FUNG|nr:hypothetical protein BG015_010271 [Linnemannia schmuckeri]
MADADTLQARKAHNHSDDESASVPIVESHSGADQYPNPFQQHVGHAHVRSSNQQHYNVMIPTVDHWPAIFLDGLKTSAHFAVFGLKKAHAKWQEFQSSRSGSGGSYQVLPTTVDTRSQQQSTTTRQTFTFGSKRQQKGGHNFNVSGRRLTRLLFFLVLVVTTILLLVLPHRLNPLEDRAIWIRYYSHEEAIKIMVPYGLKLHVSDVKKAALKEMHQGFSTFAPGNVKLITRTKGALAPDDVWDNRDWDFESSARHPILVVDTKYDLFRFLDSSLSCFAQPGEYIQQRRDQYMVSFNPQYNDYTTLAKIIDKIANGERYFQEYEIFYLREAFDDPRKNEPRTGRIWEKNSKNRDYYTTPDIGYIPHQTARPVWDDVLKERPFHILEHLEDPIYDDRR